MTYMSFCSFCGKDVRFDGTYCSECGRSHEAAMKDFGYRARDARRSLVKNVLKLVAGLALAGIMVIGFFLFPERLFSKLDETARGMIGLGVILFVLVLLGYGGRWVWKWTTRPSSPSDARESGSDGVDPSSPAQDEPHKENAFGRILLGIGWRYPHLGWRRVAIVVGLFTALVGGVYVANNTDDGRDIFLAVCIAYLLGNAGICGVVETYNWIKAGFKAS